MKAKLIISLSFVFLASVLNFLFGQTDPPSENWSNRYPFEVGPPPNNESGIGGSWIARFQGDYVVAAMAWWGPEGTPLIVFLRIDPNGKQKKRSWLLDPDEIFMGFYSLNLYADDSTGIMVTCLRYVSEEGEFLPCLMKLDGNLDTLWTKVYPNPPTFKFFGAYELVRSRYGGYIILGGRKITEGGCSNCTDAAILRIDEEGNELWRKSVGIYYSTDYFQSHFGQLTELPNGDLALVAPANPGGCAEDEAHVVLMDSLGNAKWSKTFYDPLATNIPRLISDEESNLYLTCAVKNFTTSSQSPVVPYVTKIDSLGDVIWVYQFDAPQTKKVHSKTVFAENGDLLVLGYFADASSDEDGYPPIRGWLARLTREGELLWEKFYVVEQYIFDGHGDYLLYDVVDSYDGGLVVSGGTTGSVVTNGLVDYDVWVMKLDSNGCFLPSSCAENGLQVLLPISDVATEDVSVLEGLRFYPNPSSGRLHFDLPLGVSKVSLRVRDAQGRVVLEEPSLGDGAVLDLPGSGMYFLSFYHDGRLARIDKVVVQARH